MMASKESDARLAANGNPCLTSTATLRMDDHKAHGTACRCKDCYKAGRKRLGY
jgi:hypothetical protein